VNVCVLKFIIIIIYKAWGQ